MSSAHLLRLQIESALASRIPSALSPAPRVIRPTAPTGIAVLDERLQGGLPVGAITELAGPECSGRTSLALSFLAELTRAGRVCAWVDVSDSLDPESAAAIGIDLDRLLWIRCGAAPRQFSLPGISENPSPAQTSKEEAVVPISSSTKQPLLFSEALPAAPQDFAPRCAEPQPRCKPASRQSREAAMASPHQHGLQTRNAAKRPLGFRKDRNDWTRLDQALRVTDLLLQAGGFSAIVLDMGSIAPEFSLRVPLATWFRYRAAAERTHASVILLTQQACAKSSAGVVLYLQPGSTRDQGSAVLTEAEFSIDIARERFARSNNSGVIDFSSRKPPQSDHSIRWQTQSPWAGRSTGRP